jgi:hypothetical protein
MVLILLLITALNSNHTLQPGAPMQPRLLVHRKPAVLYCPWRDHRRCACTRQHSTAMRAPGARPDADF